MEIDGKCEFQLDWYNTSDLKYDEEAHMINFPKSETNGDDIVILFTNEVDFLKFKEHHEVNKPSLDIFR